MPLFHSLFKSLEKKESVEIIVELKNDMALKGVLLSVDQHLNMRLGNVQTDERRYPQMVCLTQAAVKTCFIRGSTIRYVQLPPSEIDAALLIEATHKEHEKKG